MDQQAGPQSGDNAPGISSMQPQSSARPLGRAKASSKRKDPSQRNPRGEFGGLLNPNPERKYVRANKTGDYDVQFFQWLGYEVERVTEHGVRLAGLRTAEANEPITYKDTVLMSIPLEDWLELERYGADGKTGQAYADKIETRIIDKNSLPFGDDTMRGLFKSIPGTRVQKDVSGLRSETGNFEEYGDDE